MTRMSGVAPSRSQAYIAPERARQLGISSKISSAPCRAHESRTRGQNSRRRRGDRRPAQRLGDQRRDVALDVERIVDEVGEAVERMIVAEEAACEVERRQVLGARNHRAEAAAEQSFAADADRVEIGAVERIPERQRLVSAGGVARELQRHADRRRSARREQSLVEPRRRRFDQPTGKRGRGRVGIAARAEGQALHLAADRLDHPRMAVAELMDAVAVEIENAPPVDVGEPGALGAHDFGETGGRQRLAQKIALVLVERRARPLAQRRAPRGARRADVHVAFAQRDLARHLTPTTAANRS